MIKQLKSKFVFTNMICVALVMILVFGILYFNSARELYQNSLGAMQNAANRNGRWEYLFGLDASDDTPVYISTYTIDINDINSSAVIDGFGSIENLTEENIQYINSLINAVNRKGEKEGVLEEYNMRYLTVKTDSGKRIVLLDMSYEKETLEHLLVLLVAAGAVACVAFLIISMIIAQIAVEPVERSIKQQRQLISDISHELKTPLTVINTNADIIISHGSETVSAESQWLGYIKDEADRMKELLDMMLYLAKSDESNELAEMTDVNLTNAAFEITLPFESVCFEKGKTLEIDIDSEVYARGNETAIKQIMVIFLDNGIKYSNDSGKIVFSVKAIGDRAKISVFNTGEPIPKEAIPHLFERFYRVDESRSRDRGGSGLGLSIAKSIAEKNEGTISVSSSMENGTVFSCEFKTPKQKKLDKSNTNE